MRQAHGSTPAGLLLPTALPLLLLVSVPLAAQDAAANAHIVGVVVDRESENRLATVQVVLETLEGEEVWSGITDARGRFRVSLIPSGTYDISFSRLAYRTTTERVTVASEAEVEMRVQLASEAIELEPVVVMSSRRSALQMVGFFDREQNFDGHFFLREDIEDRNPVTVPDMIRGIPAFQVRDRAPDYPEIVSQRGGLGLMPGGPPPCPPAFFLDGRRMEGPPWDLITPDQLGGMEVYSGMMTPAQFFTENACGAIVMWTIQGDLSPADSRRVTRSALRRVLVAAAISASLFAMVF